MIQVLKTTSRKDHQVLLKPVDRNQWITAPAVVNAFYTRSRNFICEYSKGSSDSHIRFQLNPTAIPAGILQPPLYHPEYPESLNYGGIGVVIGHEVTHGFDDKGRQFDPNGNLKQWWNPSSLRNFHNKSNCMTNQYNQYYMDEIQMKVKSFF